MSFLRKILLILSFPYNYAMLAFNRVKFKNFVINGKIYIRNKGEITLGKNFKCNSGTYYNPIGGDTICRIICNTGGKIIIGNNVGISNSTIVCSDTVIIHDNVYIGGGCKIWDTDFHSIDWKERVSHCDINAKKQPVIIENFAFIGGGSLILKGITIGEGAVIGANSVVTSCIPKYEVWGGNPAKFIKKI